MSGSHRHLRGRGGWMRRAPLRDEYGAPRPPRPIAFRARQAPRRGNEARHEGRLTSMDRNVCVLVQAGVAVQVQRSHCAGGLAPCMTAPAHLDRSSSPDARSSEPPHLGLRAGRPHGVPARVRLHGARAWGGAGVPGLAAVLRAGRPRPTSSRSTWSSVTAWSRASSRCGSWAMVVWLLARRACTLRRPAPAVLYTALAALSSSPSPRWSSGASPCSSCSPSGRSPATSSPATPSPAAAPRHASVVTSTSRRGAEPGVPPSPRSASAPSSGAPRPGRHPRPGRPRRARRWLPRGPRLRHLAQLQRRGLVPHLLRPRGPAGDAPRHRLHASPRSC